jgi:hypothetical protein
VHAGPHTGLDRSYGALAAYVAEHALAVPGPIREYYLTDLADTPDHERWRTRIGWPIFRSNVSSRLTRGFPDLTDPGVRQHAAWTQAVVATEYGERAKPIELPGMRILMAIQQEGDAKAKGGSG